MTRDDERQPEPRPSGTAWNTEAERAAVVESAIQQAMRQGAFDNLPGAGKPIEDLGTHHDPDWWIRRKIQTEKLEGLGPAALTLRVEEAQLEQTLDAFRREADVREYLEDFNRRVVDARRQLMGGPPVVTALRDVEADIAAWRMRREKAPVAVEDPDPRPRRRWFRRT